MDPTEIKKTNFCPYLGLAKDADTHFDFPSSLNCCHRVNRARPVRLDVQEANCLTAGHIKCPVYAGKINGNWKGFRNQSAAEMILTPRWKHLFWLLPGLLVLLLGLGVLGVLTSRMIKSFSPAPPQGMTPPTMQSLIASAVALTDAAATAGAVAAAASADAASADAPATRIPASAVAGVSIEAATPTGTPTSPADQLSPTATLPAGTPTPGPGIATPFGPPRGEQGGYLLHRVQSGETLASLAQTYSTSVAVLAAANQPVQVHLTALAVLAGADVQVSEARLPHDIVLVVLPNLTDPAGVPRFRAVFVEKEIRVQDLVARGGVSEDDLRYYNAMEGDLISSGRWLIIPEYPQ